MVWVSLVLLALTVASITLVRLSFGLGFDNRRDRRLNGATYAAINRTYRATGVGVPFRPETAALHQMAGGAFEAALEASKVSNFTLTTVFGVYLGFLLPLFSLAFATDAIGGEREARTTVWLVSRPLPRWSIYLAKFVAVLPWTLAFNFGGFALMCAAAGRAGGVAFQLCWPSVLVSSVTFAALFHLFGAYFRWPTVVGLVYSFFLETLLGSMPGLMKRISVTFYSRCLIYDATAPYGVTPERPTVYLPVSGMTAWAVLTLATVLLLGVGMFVFSRAEYRDEV
ncbi:MAG: ABC transporter permease [Gemmataceae bacterium]